MTLEELGNCFEALVGENCAAKVFEEISVDGGIEASDFAERILGLTGDDIPADCTYNPGNSCGSTMCVEKNA